MKIPIQPHVAGTVAALSQIGYSPQTALCDLIDNCIQAGATIVQIHLNIPGNWIQIRDNGCGMVDQDVVNAFTYGKRTDRSKSLGKFGMGMKTASTSLGGRVALYSCTFLPESEKTEFTSTYVLDLDAIEAANNWEIEQIETLKENTRKFISEHNANEKAATENAKTKGEEYQPKNCTGTVLRIENLKNLLGKEYKDRTGGAFENGVDAFKKELKQQLGQIYHRFIEAGLQIRVGTACTAADPLSEKAVAWETQYDLPGVETNEDLKIKIYTTPNGGGVMIYRENRLIESDRNLFGLNRNSGYTLVFDFSQNLDNILEIDLQKSKIERLKLDSDIVTDIERKVKELKKSGKEAPKEKIEEETTKSPSIDPQEIVGNTEESNTPSETIPEVEPTSEEKGDVQYVETPKEIMGAFVEGILSGLKKPSREIETPETEVAPQPKSIRDECVQIFNAIPKEKLPQVLEFLKSV